MMDLWIKTQKKGLHKIIGIDEPIEVRDIFRLIGHNGHTLIELGAYKTEERVLEVLDDITNLLKPKYILNASSIKEDGSSWVENGVIMQKYNAEAKIEQLNYYVYEMPKE